MNQCLDEHVVCSQAGREEINIFFQENEHSFCPVSGVQESRGMVNLGQPKSKSRLKKGGGIQKLM